MLSFLGIRSSEESTLLNTTFGLDFVVRAGRCINGIDAHLIPVAKGSSLPFEYMLVLDLEGFRSLELEQSYVHDIVTLVIGMADLAIINMNGDNVSEVSNILQIVVRAFLKMKLADKQANRHCIFMFHNVPALKSATKFTSDRKQFQEQLDTLTKEASKEQSPPDSITSFSQIMNFDIDSDVVYFPNLWNGDSSKAKVNQEYPTHCADIRHNMLTNISTKISDYKNISDICLRVEDMWHGVLSNDFVSSFQNSLVTKTHIELERDGWMDERCFRPLLCTVKAELGRGQPGLMR